MTDRKTPQQKMLTKYKNAMKVLDEIAQFGWVGREEKEIYEFAQLVLMGISGRCKELFFSIQREHQDPIEKDWAQKIAKNTLEAALKIIDGDGHTLFDPEAFRNAGMPEYIVDYFTAVHATDLSSPQGVMFDSKGNLVPYIEGIYGLEMLRSMASSLGAKASSALGRGFEARELTKNIEEHLKTMNTNNT